MADGGPDAPGAPDGPGARGRTTRRWAERRDRVLANRAVSVPTLTVRRFFEIEGVRKANLLAFNLFICVIPLTIMLFAAVSSVRRNVSLGQVFVEQFRLRGETARIARGMFAPNNRVLKVTSFIVIASFAVSGFDVGSILEKTFAQAWRVEPLGGWRGAARGGVWFALCFALFVASQALQAIPARHGGTLYALTLPVVLALNYGFWMVTPRLLLDKELGWRDLRPSALVGCVASTGLWVASLLILPGWFDWYGRGFGAIGLALAMLAWTYVVTIFWVLITCAAAAYWERTADVDDVVSIEDAT